MSWPEAFSSVGGGAIFAAFLVFVIVQSGSCLRQSEFERCTEKRAIAECREIYRP